MTAHVGTTSGEMAKAVILCGVLFRADVPSRGQNMVASILPELFSGSSGTTVTWKFLNTNTDTRYTVSYCQYIDMMRVIRGLEAYVAPSPDLLGLL